MAAFSDNYAGCVLEYAPEQITERWSQLARSFVLTEWKAMRPEDLDELIESGGFDYVGWRIISKESETPNTPMKYGVATPVGFDHSIEEEDFDPRVEALTRKFCTEWRVELIKMVRDAYRQSTLSPEEYVAAAILPNSDTPTEDLSRALGVSEEVAEWVEMGLHRSMQKRSVAKRYAEDFKVDCERTGVERTNSESMDADFAGIPN